MSVLVRSFVRSVAGRTMAIEIGSGDTVSSLKAKICLEEGIVPSLQRLMYGGNEMDDHRRVESFGLYNQCIDLSVRRFPQASDHSHSSSFASSAGLLSQQPGQLRGYFFHPTAVKPGVNRYSAVRPVHRYSLRYVGVEDRRELLLDKHLPLEASGYDCVDSHLGLLVLQPPADKDQLGFVVWDPVSEVYACLPPPPEEALQQNAAFILNDTSFDIDVPENIGGVILSRKEGKLLEFELVYVTMEREGTSTSVKPRAWIATYDGKDCCWNCAPLSRTLEIDGPLFMDRYCVRANGQLFWHLHGSGIVNKSIISFDPVRKAFAVGLVPRAGNRLGENSDGALIAGAVVQHEHLLLSQRRAKGYWQWSPMVLAHYFDLSEALNQVPALSSRIRRVTRMTDFDAGWPQSVLIKTSGNGRFRFQVDSGKLERLVTSDGLEWGHPIFPYFG